MNVRLAFKTCCLLTLLSSHSAYADSERLQAVRAFADTVLEQAGDHYHGDNPSPLLASGVNPHTGEQMEWIFPDGRTAVLSNFSAQQNFMRVLVGLSDLTGDERYRENAEQNVRYYFDHFQDESGLLYWGGHRFVDLKTLEPEGPSEKELVHELKNAYPYYELMFDVDPEATMAFIRAFWNAHVYDWEVLETSRHGEYGLERGALWDSDFTQQPPFFETRGLSFLNTGNDLIYSAGLLYHYNDEPGALTWAKRLAEQYVLPRDPETGLGVYQFTQPLKRDETDDDGDTHSKYGDRAQRQFGPEFGANALEGNMLLRARTGTIYSENALMQLALSEALGDDGEEIKQWTIDGLKAFAQYAYDEASNTFRPMIADGTDLSNYTLPRDGYYGKQGTVLEPYEAGSNFLLSYARAYTMEQDADLWRVARGIAQGQELGDIGEVGGQNPDVDLTTRNDDPHTIFALTDLWKATGQKAYLDLADKVADNILQNKRVNDFFVRSLDVQYAEIDSIDPYALLALEAAHQSEPDAIAPFLNGGGFTEGAYLMANGDTRFVTSDNELFSLKQGEELQPNGRR